MVLLVMAPSPQQVFSNQGVLRIPGFSFKVCCYLLLFVIFFCYLLFLFSCYCYSLKFLLILCGDVETNPGPRGKCRVLYNNIRGLMRNFSDLQIASRDYDIIFCSETMVTSRRHVSELLIPGFNNPTLLLKSDGKQGLVTYIRNGFSASLRNDLTCKCPNVRHEIQLVKIGSRTHNFYVFNIYRSPSANDSIYDCLMTSMSHIQELDRKSCFVFVGDFNAHHRDWLNSISETNPHGVAALDFANLTNCEQLIVEPTHIRGNRLDLLLTDVPGVVDASVKPPLGNSDHSVISFDLMLRSSVPNVQFSQLVYLKHRTDWTAVNHDLAGIQWSGIYRSDNPIEALNDTLVSIIGRRVPTKVIKRRMKDKVWFDDRCRSAYQDKQEAYGLWSRNRSPLLWENFERLRDRAETVYIDAQSDYNNRIRASLADEAQPRKWWSSLKNFIFGVDSALPPIRLDDGAVTHDPLTKAEVLSATFLSKQSGQVLNLPSTCFPCPKLTYFAFRSSEVKSYLNDLDSSGGTDPNQIFPMFLRNSATILAPKLAKIFRDLLKAGSFPACWRTANITPIPKGSSPTQFPSDYRPISITPIISKIFERLISRRLYSFIEANDLLPNSQFGFRKGLGTSDALLTLTNELQFTLDKFTGAESRVVSLDFSSAFDRVNHDALLYKLSLMGIGGPVFNVLKEFLSERKQCVAVDGKFSNMERVLSGVPQGSVLGPLLFILFTADLGDNLENKIVSYADDTTLFARISNPSERISVARSLNRDLAKIQSWCELWGMKLNPKKTHSMIVSRSRTLYPPHPPLSLCGTSLEESDHLLLLGVTLDSKLTFEKHIRQMAASISQKIGILRKCYRTLGRSEAINKSFFAYVLPCFEYCAPVWSSAADSHLKLLDRALNKVKFYVPDISLNLWRRRAVSCLSLLYKIYHDPKHMLHSSLYERFVPARPTRNVLRWNDLAFRIPTPRTEHFSRNVIHFNSGLWNILPNHVVYSEDLKHFKAALKLYLNSLVRENIPRQHLPFLSRLL